MALFWIPIPSFHLNHLAFLFSWILWFPFSFSNCYIMLLHLWLTSSYTLDLRSVIIKCGQLEKGERLHLSFYAVDNLHFICWVCITISFILSYVKAPAWVLVYYPDMWLWLSEDLTSILCIFFFLIVKSTKFASVAGWKRKRCLRKAWLPPQRLWKVEFKMHVMMLVVYALKPFATVILPQYVQQLSYLSDHYGFYLIVKWLKLWFQVTSCKHEFHLQCILEWYKSTLLIPPQVHTHTHKKKVVYIILTCWVWSYIVIFILCVGLHLCGEEKNC